MKTVCFLMGALLVGPSVHAAVDRDAQVIAKFISLANDGSTDIAKKLQTVRQEKANGFRNEEQVIPKVLKAADFKIIETENETYYGKVTGPDDQDREPGYEDRVYSIFVPAEETSYGGRINAISTVKFECILHADDFEAPQADVTCKEK
ncbi:hypothetical protein [Bdellovibrio bacteriovorus]|uniref:hypothetical protein n=1 Tax=Bdellovibrio bacteriovorus TaxID=959 RepID=UPI0035A61219